LNVEYTTAVLILVYTYRSFMCIFFSKLTSWGPHFVIRSQSCVRTRSSQCRQ